MSNEDLLEIEKVIEQRKQEEAVGGETPAAPETEKSLTVEKRESKAVLVVADAGGAIGEVKQKIIQKAADKIHDEKIIEKHSDNIAKISDRALEAEEEKQRLIVEQVNADNKVVAQEIKNRLIVLKAEAKRLKAEQKQLNKDQKAAHKARNKQAKWALYGDKLTRLKYDYVPNAFILSMLLFFDGARAFFDGLGSVSTSIVKACKWIFIGGLFITAAMSIPATREWLLSVMKFK